MNNDKKLVPAPLILLAATFLCSIGGVCIKMSTWAPLSINCARGLIAALITFLYIKARRHKLKFNFTVLCGGLSLALTMLFYVLANRMTSAAHAILLMYTSPIFVILYLWVFKGKKPNATDSKAALIVFIGICTLCFDGILKGNLCGDFVALASGIAYAGVFLVNTGKNGDALSSFFCGQLFAGVIGVFSLLKERDFTFTPVLAALLLGVFQLGLSYILMAKALECVAPVAASLITALEPVLSTLWVALFCGEALNSFTVIGALLVLVSIIYSRIYADKKSVKDRQ